MERASDSDSDNIKRLTKLPFEMCHQFAEADASSPTFIAKSISTFNFFFIFYIFLNSTIYIVTEGHISLIKKKLKVVFVVFTWRTVLYISHVLVLLIFLEEREVDWRVSA